MNTLPAVPTPDPCDHRVSSAPVLIQTVSGEWYTARWVVYVDQDDDGIPPCWELVGRDGLQLDRDEVVQWFDCAAVAGLVEASRTEYAAQEAYDKATTGKPRNDTWAALLAARERRRAALACIGGDA